MEKEVHLTPRDKQFFLDLYDLVFLDMDYLQKVIYQTSTPAIYRRMAKLEKSGYITSFKLAIVDNKHGGSKHGGSKNVYTLDRNGYEEVREYLGEAYWDPKWTKRTPTHIYHCLEMADVYGSFKLSENENLDVYDWLNERRGQHRWADGRDGQIKPDAMLILKAKRYDVYAGIMMELERSKQRKEVNIRKLERYNRYCELKCYENQDSIDVKLDDPPRIIFISALETEMLNLMDHTKDVDTSSTKGVLYTTFEKIKTDPYGKIYLAKKSKDPERLYSITERVEME